MKTIIHRLIKKRQIPRFSIIQSKICKSFRDRKIHLGLIQAQISPHYHGTIVGIQFNKTNTFFFPTIKEIIPPSIQRYKGSGMWADASPSSPISSPSMLPFNHEPHKPHFLQHMHQTSWTVPTINSMLA